MIITIRTKSLELRDSHCLCCGNVQTQASSSQRADLFFSVFILPSTLIKLEMRYVAHIFFCCRSPKSNNLQKQGFLWPEINTMSCTQKI